jgi:hypothetical protein
MMASYVSHDNRLLPTFGERFWCTRTSEREWQWCKYCGRDVPTFILDVGSVGSLAIEQRLRCCWECGSGLEQLEVPEVDDFGEAIGEDDDD